MKNILVITYWSFHDALVQTYTLPYLHIIMKNLPEGSSIFLVTLDKSNRLTAMEKQALADKNIIPVSLKYHPFGLKAFFHWIPYLFKLFMLCFKHKIFRIHTLCTPAGAIGYLLSKTTGVPLVLDSFEPHAESMAESGTWSRNSWAFKILFKLEKLQAGHARDIIATTAGMKDYSKKKYGLDFPGMLVKPACVNLEQFSAKNRKNESLVNKLNLQNKIVCVYAGKFGGSYLEKEIFDFFKVASDFWKDKFHVLLLTGHSESEIYDYAKGSGLNFDEITIKFMEHHNVPNYMGLGNFAITPFKPVPSKRYGSPIKNGEYWALGLPVVITPDISDDSGIIEHYEIGCILTELHHHEYLKCIKRMDEKLKNETHQMLYEKIRPVAEKYRNFSIAEEVYKQIYS